MSYPHNKLNLEGKRFSRLVVQRQDGVKRFPCGSSVTTWLCACDCGNHVTVLGPALKSGNTKSCGCLRGQSNITHGQARHETRPKEYRIWQAMLNRCRNSSVPSYERYGGRGINVCSRWAKFENFIADMGDCPEGCSIDRIDNDGDYCPDNCTWSTRTEQARNKYNNRVIEFQGQSKLLCEWAEGLGMDQSSLRERLDKWPLERALTEPKRR